MAKTDKEIVQHDGSKGGTATSFFVEETRGQLAGFVVVMVQATPSARYVEAQGYLNNVLVCRACGADNYNGTISTPTGSFTMPVRFGDSWRVTGNVASAITLTTIPT
ncbi:MAG TPA: hypothetical protein VH331_12625 [Allosphingosinicella sp.]|jgi:hypothetical protein|nr:hypothetical protein [Allosphingosinicella sp.]